MQTIYRLKANQLNENFLEGLKTTFKDKEIEIIVSEVDETNYLLQSVANQKRLLSAIANVNNHTNLTTIELNNLEDVSEESASISNQNI